MKTRRQAVGQWGELLAEEYLIKAGCQILGKNIHTQYGEIDLVVRCGNQLIFVEVKTRTNQSFGNPEDSITPKKQIHMVRSAQAFLQENLDLENLPWRIDVISIHGKPGNLTPEIVYFENAL